MVEDFNPWQIYGLGAKFQLDNSLKMHPGIKVICIALSEPFSLLVNSVGYLFNDTDKCRPHFTGFFHAKLMHFSEASIF